MAPSFSNRRRASTKKGEKNYGYHSRTVLLRDRSPSDYGVDNFSYDKDHVEKWTIPADVLDKLPPELQKSATEWQYAGAALCTALERIKKLDDESVYRGYPEPEHSTHPHLSRRASNAQWNSTMTGAGTDTPPMSSPPSSAPISLNGLPPSLLPLEKTFSNGFSQRQVVVGMESPPFTPVDSETCPTPEYPQSVPFTKNAMPDVNALTRQLSPISMREISMRETSMRDRGESIGSSLYSTASFDESAWDVYLNTFKAEMLDIRTEALPRLKGLGHTVDKLSIEYARDGKFKAAIEDFNVWWTENKGKANQWEERVRMLELPSLDHMRKERLSMGMSI